MDARQVTAIDDSFETSAAGSGEWEAEEDAAEEISASGPPAVDPAIYGIESDASSVHTAAAKGTETPGDRMPFYDQIQQAFGRHDISGIQSHTGGDHAAGIGAKAYAMGNHVVFDKAPDLHTAAHEAAHVVQQARGVNLYGGVGDAGDAYERSADAVADRVVAGQSASDLLGAPTSGPVSAAPAAVQRKELPSGAPELNHNDYTLRGDGDRAQAIGAQMRLVAMQINQECDTLEQMIDPANDGDLRGVDPIIETDIHASMERLKQLGFDIYPLTEQVTRMNFKDHGMTQGLRVLNKARGRASSMEIKVRKWARRNGGEAKYTDFNVQSIMDHTRKFSNASGLAIDGANGVGAEEETEDQATLMKSAVANSLSALDSSSTALLMAVGEDNADDITPRMITRVRADLKLFSSSLPPQVNSVSQTTIATMSSVVMRLGAAHANGMTKGLQKYGTDSAVDQASALLSRLQAMGSKKPAAKPKK